MKQRESGEYVWNWVLGKTESRENRTLSWIREYSPDMGVLSSDMEFNTDKGPRKCY